MVNQSRVEPPHETREQTRSVLRLSYAQSMLTAIYGASTGGMFLVGFAKMLGSDLHEDRLNVLIGLMSTIPMLCVVGQLVSALKVESGTSRRALSFYGALFNLLLWPLVVLIPVVGNDLSSENKLYCLIGLIACMTFFGHICVNARASWVGDLIPGRFRGPFFGKMAMFASLVATAFAVIEGACLDRLQDWGETAFSMLFLFGMIFGLGNALLFRPQPDIPIVRDKPILFRHLLLAALKNKPLLATMGFMLVFTLQTVAAPFYVKYMLDLDIGFFGVGVINAMVALTMVVCAPFWGRVVQRFGCRPVLLLCVLILGPLQLVWLMVDTPLKAYCVIIPVNVIAGFVIGGLNVSINTLLYKVTQPTGRSVQFALNTIAVTLIAAPMPWLGGHLPPFLRSLGIESADLRWTFYAAGVFFVLSAIVGTFIRETNARPLSHLVRYLLGRKQ